MQLITTLTALRHDRDTLDTGVRQLMTRQEFVPAHARLEKALRNLEHMRQEIEHIEVSLRVADAMSSELKRLSV